MVDISLEDLIDFELLGIISNLNNAYQFVYHLNTTYGSNFVRDVDLDIKIGENYVYYANFIWEDHNNQITYHILKNAPFQSLKPETLSIEQMFDVLPMLVPQHKNYNYILKISGWDFGLEQLNLPFRVGPIMQSITPFNVEQIRTLEHLVF